MNTVELAAIEATHGLADRLAYVVQPLTAHLNRRQSAQRRSGTHTQAVPDGPAADFLDAMADAHERLEALREARLTRGDAEAETWWAECEALREAGFRQRTGRVASPAPRLG